MSKYDLNNFKRLLKTMKENAKLTLNPKGYYLTSEALKRLRWMYVLYYEADGNVKKASKKIGVSRQWLSTLKSTFENHHKDPRSLEPKSKAPIHTDNRKRIQKDLEKLIVKLREEHVYGKTKLKVVLKRDYDLTVGSSTINKYLHSNGLINPKISAILIKANKEKKKRQENKEILDNVKFRSPLMINDLKPGAKVEKDMKLIHKPGCDNVDGHQKNYWYQQTITDTFTRIRSLTLTKNYKSKTIAKILPNMLNSLGFNVATINTDNGSENEGDINNLLRDLNIIHFQSRPGTPTDNPRVERSHKTDDQEFYQQGNIYKTFDAQQKALKRWEWEYNYYRPHQALGYLTPIAFKQLYDKDPEKAYAIVEKYREELRKNRERLKKSRQIKDKKQVDELINFIEIKTSNKSAVSSVNLPSWVCQWCS